MKLTPSESAELETIKHSHQGDPHWRRYQELIAKRDNPNPAMNTNHSPLPWTRTVVRSENQTFYVSVIAGQDDSGVCEVQNQANAAYIVQACNAYPALVEALEACLHRLDERDEQSAPECLQARAALALARGEKGESK